MTPSIQQAIQLHQQGQLDAAQHIYQLILKQDKKNSDAHNLLGAVFVAKKQFKEAERHLVKASKLSPKYAPIHYNLGKCYVDMGDVKKAIQPLNKAISLDDKYVDAWFLRANVFVQLNQLKEAETGYRKLLTLAPNHLEGLNNLGNALQEQNRPAEALPYHQKAIDLEPQFFYGLLGLAAAMQALEMNEQAIDIYDQALLIAETADLYLKKGVCIQQLGDMQEARKCYFKAIELDPLLGAAYRNNVEITKYNSLEEVEYLKRGLAMTMDDKDRFHMCFAWGKVNDSLGNYEDAFAAYDEGNGIHRKSYKYSIDEDKSLFKLIEKTYSKEFLDKKERIFENAGEGAIFILGMPRSGTTLVEQIISSHSLVTGAGELETLGHNVKASEGGATKFHRRFPNMPQHEWQRISQNYEQHLRDLSEEKPIVTDKMPHNFLYMGMIAKLLPKAKIVHCQRHPVANCLSIYKAYFSSKGSHKYAYNLKELAQYHNLYEELMQHWRTVMADNFYEIKYEELTSNQEQESRKLIEYCGLEWQEACLDFHKTKRQVKTASAFQVRQPMNQNSIGLWKKYGDALQPLLDVVDIPEEYQV